MQETQLACPHCGSTLTFGQHIAAGTPVECLICMRTFAAEPLPVASPGPSTFGASTFGAPCRGGSPAVVHRGQADGDAEVAAAGRQKSGARRAVGAAHSPSAGVFQRSRPSNSGRDYLLSLSGACRWRSVVIWKIATAVQDVGNSVENPPFAVGPTTDPPKDLIPTNNKNVVPEKKSNDPVEIDEETLKIKAAEKKLLVRKTPAGANAPEIDWTPINVKEQRPMYAGLSQKNIDGAIEKGVGYLRKTQLPTGTWGEGHGIGYASLAGLTLLECNVPANDNGIQRAAHYVRTHINLQKTNMTYEVSLAILFLDRLGDFRDRPMIQGLALRLLAGQNDCGGWSYNCPQLNPQDVSDFTLSFTPTASRRCSIRWAAAPCAPVAVPNPKPQDIPAAGNAFQQFGALMAKGIENTAPEKNNPGVPQKKTTPLRPEWLKAELQRIPVVKNQGKGKGKQRVGGGARRQLEHAVRPPRPMGRPPPRYPKRTGDHGRKRAL